MKIVVRAFETLRSRKLGKIDESQIVGEARSCRELLNTVSNQPDKDVYLSYYNDDGTLISDYETAWTQLGGTVILNEDPEVGLMNYYDENGNLVYTE